MGTFAVPIQVGDLSGQRFAGFEATVDTGSTFTVLPGDKLIELGARPTRLREFQLADDSVVQYRVGHTLVRINGEEEIVPVVFGLPGVPPLLGATTLEIFLLAVDPAQQKLVSVRGLMKSATPRN